MMFLSRALFHILLAPVVFACFNHDKCCNLTTVPSVLDKSNCSHGSKRYSLESAVLWPDDSLGRLDVTFPFDIHCEFKQYNLVLYVYENMTEEACGGCNFSPVAKKHSERNYCTLRPDQTVDHHHEEQICEGTCGEAGMVTFHYVFTGCYQFGVQHHDIHGTKQRIFSCSKYFHTKYKKQLITEIIPNIRHEDREALLSTQISIAFAPFIFNHPYIMDVKLRENIDVKQEEACYKTGRDHTECLVNNTACFCEEKRSDKYGLQCSIEDNEMQLEFKNLSPGNYCTMVTMVEDRCRSGTLWTENSSTGLCNWYFSFSMGERTSLGSTVPSSDLNSNRFYIILGVVCAVVVASIVIVLLIVRSYITKHRLRTALPILPSSMIPMEPSRIFLLYARDCQPFMTLMATFREVLEDTTKCEVIDCLDASRWNEVGRRPVDWVRSYIEQPNTKVVLVATHCSYLRQQALLQQVTTHYKEPENYDNLFIFGLKALTESLSFDIYRKVCVVRFEGFSDDEVLFSHLTPYTRFVLPMHLHKLVANLRLSALPEQNDQLIENKEVQKLSKDLTQLINYKNKNFNYLHEMLSIQRNEVVC